MAFKERFDDVLDKTLAVASGATAPDRVLLMTYEPELEPDFRLALGECLRALSVRGIANAVVDLRLLPYEVLDDKGLLNKAFELQARQPDRFQQDLARRLEPVVVSRIVQQASALGPGLIVLGHSAALFPWVSYSSVMKLLPSGLPSLILVPFPGTEEGASLHFMGRRNGFDYMARRV